MGTNLTWTQRAFGRLGMILLKAATRCFIWAGHDVTVRRIERP